MKIPMKWLGEYVRIPVASEEFARRMILSGTAVEGIEATGGSFEGVVVGKIVSIRPHPDSDHLLICRVDVGREALQIVTGAPNVREGDLVPVAVEGARLPGGIIREGSFRGAPSYGMLCSGPELGVPEALYPHVGEAGILIFREERELGSDAKLALGLGDEVADFEILANRPDCLSVWGIAREAAAVFETRFEKPVISISERGDGTFSDFASVEVEGGAPCRRYCARVARGVRVGPSPLWMREALFGAGIRPINNLVDVTNYVMLETGHPMHAFDLDRVSGRSIVVRPAREGEILATLDGKNHALNPSMLVIADRERATGLAGIMGGEESEISDSTSEVLIECAAFDRTSVRLTARALGIRTESSGRFERGVSAASAMEAIDRACMLIESLGCGSVVPGCFDHYPDPEPERVVVASAGAIARRVAVGIGGEEMARILGRLGFEATIRGDELTARVPPYRSDVETEADLSEEILRLYGYDAIPSTLPIGRTVPGGRGPKQILLDRVRETLTGFGYYEATAYSFVSPKAIRSVGIGEGDPRLDPIEILNPLGEDTSVLRTTLLPSMLGIVSMNLTRWNAEGRLYEIAPAFLKRPGELPEERLTLQMAAFGAGEDFYSIKRDVCGLLEAFGIDAEFRAGGDGCYHPGRRAELFAGGVRLGDLGEIHPDTGEAFGIERRVYAARVDLEPLQAAAVPFKAVAPLPKYPSVARDLALVVGEAVELGPVIGAIRASGGELLEEIRLFDVYRGAPLLEGEKGAAFSLTFRSPDRTLSDGEAAEAIEGILSACAERFGARLRS